MNAYNGPLQIMNPMEEQFCLLDPPCDNEIECQTTINTNYFFVILPYKTNYNSFIPQPKPQYWLNFVEVSP